MANSNFPRAVEVLVVGAGPAGLAATKKLIDAGVSVLLIDARKRIGHPVRCAELTRPNFFQVMGFEPREGWVRLVLEQPRGWFILNRSRTESEMAQLLAKDGAIVRASASAVAVRAFGSEGRRVVVRTARGSHTVSAKLVIAADGVSSQTAGLAGMDTRLPLDDIASALAYRIVGAKLARPRAITTEYYPELEPYYFWVFPSGHGEANVGLGIPGLRGHAARPQLDRLIADTEAIEGGRVVEEFVGIVPVAYPLAQPYADGLLVVGGAARLVHALSGEGIWQAAVSGTTAAQVFLDTGRRATPAASLETYLWRVEELYAELSKAAKRRRALGP